jgi:hypothetical protein
LTYDEETQNAAQINMLMRCLAANYIISYNPRHGYVKPNVGVGFDVDTLQRTVEAVIQDHHGKFIAVAERLIFASTHSQHG